MNKIQTIHTNLKFDHDPLYLLTKIVPRRSEHNLFNLKLISIKDTLKIIRSMKCSHSTGDDDISNAILKKLDIHIAYQIFHMTKCVMRTTTFPDIFITTRSIMSASLVSLLMTLTASGQSTIYPHLRN